MALRRIVRQPDVHPFCPIGELLTVIRQPVNELKYQSKVSMNV